MIFGCRFVVECRLWIGDLVVIRRSKDSINDRRSNDQERFNDQRSTKSRMCSNMRPRIITSAVIVAALAVGLSGQAANNVRVVCAADAGWPPRHAGRLGQQRHDAARAAGAVWGNRATMTDAELADLKKRAQKLIDGGDAFFADELILAALEGRTKFSSADTQTGNYDQTWLSERIWDNRTSLIIDPPDGRIPPPAPAAAERARAQAAARQGRGPADRAQDLSLSTRCVHARHTQYSRGLPELLRHHAGPWRRRAAHRDDPRRARGPDGRLTPRDGIRRWLA